VPTPSLLADGAHTIVATETTPPDSASATLTFTLDTIPPAVSESLSHDSGASANDGSPTPTLPARAIPTPW